MSACCKSCGKELSRRLRLKIAKGEPTSGLCAPCWRASVKIERRCVDCSALVHNRKAQRCRKCGNARLAADPAFEAHRLERMREALTDPAVRERKAIGSRRYAAKKMAWLPDHHREEYFRILNKVGRAEIARGLIRERMTPFERQISRVMEGKARVVPKISIRPREHDFTLGGVSAEWMG